MKNEQENVRPRRRFLGLLAASGTALLAGDPLAAHAKEQTKAQPNPRPLVDSPPVLQCPGPDSMTVVWAVGKPATGHIEFGTKKDALDREAHGEVLGLNPYHDRFLHVRLEGLEPNTRYYYRTATSAFTYHNAYKFTRGEPEFGDVYSFETPGPNKATGSFAVMNDTHQNQKTLKLLTDRLKELGADYTVWNGDLVNSIDSADQAVEAILRPANAPFAAEHPLLFAPGNHDYRGSWARNLSLALPNWPITDVRDRELGRNFAVRNGPLALIGLDTGEDKPDRHPAWAGMARFEPYRVAQRDWLERTLAKPEIASAPFAVAFCHIPLFDARPDANDGNQIEGWASYQRQSAELWGPLLVRHGIQLVVCAHKHAFRFDAATPERPWAQVVGGGHGKEPITVIHGKATADSLEVVVDELVSGTELGRWTFAARKKSV